MKATSQSVDITVQKKFKELLDAKREGRSFDFKNELKKELEIMLRELNDNNSFERRDIENLLQEIEKRRLKISCTQ